jgi:hypothetical protein
MFASTRLASINSDRSAINSKATARAPTTPAPAPVPGSAPAAPTPDSPSHAPGAIPARSAAPVTAANSSRESHTVI